MTKCCRDCAPAEPLLYGFSIAVGGFKWRITVIATVAGVLTVMDEDILLEEA